MNDINQTTEENLKNKLLNEERKEIKNYILEAIGIESLRKEISEEIKRESSKFSEFFKHPTILLLLGFLFTTGLGAYLTSRYQSNDWQRQQVFLSKQQHINEKRAVSDEVTKTIAETVSAADDILFLFSWTISDSEKIKRQETWQQASSKWRNSHNVLSQKITVYFKNEEIHRLFGEIVQERKIIGNSITNLIEVSNNQNKTTPSQAETAKNTLNEVNNIRKKIADLAKLMVEEMIDDRKPPKPSYFPFF